MNVVQFIWHDLGDNLSCYGRPEIPSPRLETFAAEGVVFERHFCTSPQCSPSRGALMTGRYPHSNGLMGLTHRGWSYAAGERDLPDLLNDAGFDTWLFGFEHERNRQDPKRFTYRHVVNTERHCNKVAPEACAFFRSDAAKRQPFYVNIGFTEVHRNFGLDYDPEVLAKVKVPGFLPDLPVVRKDLATFYENIRRADDAVGRVLDAIREAKLDESTLVFFTTDHGMPFPRAKMSLYDPGIKVAFLMRLPGVIEAGTRVSHLVSNVDVLPTVLDAVKVAVPENVQGRSFWPLLTGGAYVPREEVIADVTWHGGQYDPTRCIRTGRWKYIRNFIPGRPVLIQGPAGQRYGADVIDRYFSAWRPEQELYDLKSDPDERTNLAKVPEYGPILADLGRRLERILRETSDPLLEGDIPAPPEEGDYDSYWHTRRGA
ncbi:MAG TPA: sulfatase, partial [Planctomycetota bacterium]|nr:sulfatase [Planctomycetota bacterium]